MKKKIYTLSVLLAAVLPAGAQSIKSDINTVLNDIALPVFLGVMVMALAVGIGKNWRLINDENSEGNKKQGWMNVAYMVGYVLIAVTVISFCVGKIPSFYMTLALFLGQVLAGVLLDMVLAQAFPMNSLIGGLFVLGGLSVNLTLDRAYEKKNAAPTA